MTRRWLYLPIDVKVRELESKTFLALRAAKRGYNVIIGQKQLFPRILSCFPAGHYIGFGGISTVQKEYERFRAQGHGIVLMDEEGLVTHKEEMYARNRLVPETLNLCERFVAWGQEPAGMALRNRPDLKEKMIVSGNPRMDILQPQFLKLFESETKRIQNEHGNFILFNSTFGSSNHFIGGDAYLASLLEKKFIRSDEEYRYYRSYFSYRHQVMLAIQSALPALAQAFPYHKIIIRPHPSENHEAWKEAIKNLPNAAVIHEGSVIPWMLAAGALIHNYCTTSLEYFAMGRTAIAYRPVIDESLESPLPTIASMESRTPQELIDAVRFVLSRQPDRWRGDKTKILSYWIENLSGGYAADKILDSLNEISLTSKPKPLAPLAYKGIKTARRIKNTLRPAHNAYLQHKFAPIDRAEMRTLIQNMETTPGEYADIRLKTLDRNLYWLNA